MKILVLGGVSYDDIIHVNDFSEIKKGNVFVSDSYSTFGSTGVGKSLALKKIGFDVSFHSIIGDDYYGKAIIKEMKKEGIKFYPYISEFTERHTNIVNEAGERISIFSHTPQNFIVESDKYEKLIRDADIIVLNVNNYCRYFIPLLRKYHKKVFCDIQDYNGFCHHHLDFIRNSNCIFMNSDNMENYRSFMEKMINEGKECVVVTHGENGATALNENGYVDIPTNIVKVVDKGGAGDNFFAGYLYGYLNGYDTKDSLLMGRIMAESCIITKNIVSDEISEEFLLENYKKLKNLVEKIYDIV